MQGFKIKSTCANLAFICFELNYLCKSHLWKNISCIFKPENRIVEYYGTDSDKYQNQDPKMFEKLYLPPLERNLNSHAIMLIQWKCSSILNCAQENSGKDNIWMLECSGKRKVAEAKRSFLFTADEIV